MIISCTTPDVAPHAWAGRRIPDMVDLSATRWPTRPAIVDGERVVTYDALAKAMRGVAKRLNRAGVREGDHVAIFLAESWRHVVLIAAVMQVGAVVVPLNLTWQTDELAYALEAAEVDFLIAGTTHRGRDLLAALRGIGIEPTPPKAGTKIGRLTRVFWDVPPAEGIDSLHDLFVDSEGPLPTSTNQVGYLMFTSGSSARPKLAIIRQDAALGCAFFAARQLRISATDRCLNVLPFYHCGGLIVGLLAAHMNGAQVRIFEGFQQDEMVDALWKDDVDILVSGFDVITMRLVTGAKRDGRVPFDRVVSGPGRDIFDELSGLGVDVAIAYAMTEASNVVSLSDSNDPLEFRKNSNGYPLPGVEVIICHPDTGARMPPGDIGEIRFRGWNRMVGYYTRGGPPALTLDGDGFFKTGDQGYLDTAGRLYYRGRYSAMIKTGGENVSGAEVENALRSAIRGLVNVSVVGIPDEKWGETVAAFVEIRDGEFVSAESVRAACRGLIAGYKIPRHVFVIDAHEWPLTPTGKVESRQLAKRAVEILAQRDAGICAPRGASESYREVEK